MQKVELKVVRADVADVETDMLLLKYARRFYGADESIAFRMIKAGLIDESDIDPAVNDAVTVKSDGEIAARNVMFLGTQRLGKFRYKQMREYAFRAIELIDQNHQEVQSLSVTVHGAGYGLDIEESLHALVFGFQQAFSRGLAPNLKSLTFVERNGRRFDIIRRSLSGVTHLSRPAVIPVASEEPAEAQVNEEVKAKQSRSRRSISSVPPSSELSPKKKLVFVAMPFAQEFEDVYQFGIYDVVRRCGFVCERVDESYYAGNMVERIKEGINSAEFVIADLTTERPNVYLEVGYAWGLDKPVLLIAREGQNLHFDLAQHKCIFYPTIVRLADDLEKTIRNMFIES